MIKNTNLKLLKDRIIKVHNNLQETNKFLIELYDVIIEYEKELKNAT